MKKANAELQAQSVSVNEEKGCPWVLMEWGDAGTKEYAEQCKILFEDAFEGEWKISCTDKGWWYAEEVE